MKNKTALYIKGTLLIILLNIIACAPSKKITNTPSGGPAEDYLQALLQFEPWAESVWHDYPDIPRSGYFGDGKTTGNGGIRGTCGIALSYAVLVKAFPDDPRRSHRIKRIEEALRYAEETHQGTSDSVVAVDGKKWGVRHTTGMALQKILFITNRKGRQLHGQLSYFPVEMQLLLPPFGRA